MSDALKPAMHGRDHRPGGEDPITGWPCWMSVDTRDFGFESIGDGSDYVGWLRFFQSDNSLDTFDYEPAAPVAGSFGEDTVIPKIKKPGIYTWCYYIFTGDVETSTHPVQITSQIELLGSAGLEDPFPGRVGGGTFITETHYVPDLVSGGDDLIVTRSITLPLYKSTQTTPQATGKMILQHPDTYVWTARLWVVRHGDIFWDATTHDTFDTPTWPT